jgi:aryl-alcohol dehydrogenase-like predicted oxidoreductase
MHPAWASPRIVIGTMNFGARTPEPEAFRIVDRALEAGLDLFDTGNVYGDGESERIVGRALLRHPGRMRVATKVGIFRRDGRREGLSAKVVATAAEESLRRLGVDALDLYYLHAPDHDTRIEETVAAMARLLEAGKVRAWGVSNYASWQILEIESLCGASGVAKPVVSQVLYNLLIRQLDLEYFKYTRAHPIHTTVYNPLAGGLLAGRVGRGEKAAKGSRFDGNRLYQGRYLNERMFDLVDDLAVVAREAGMSLVDLSYAWLAGRAGVDSVLVGPGSVEHLEVAISASGRTLDDATRARIDEIHRAWSGTDTSYAR